jgi:hypothetical protein
MLRREPSAGPAGRPRQPNTGAGWPRPAARASLKASLLGALRIFDPAIALALLPALHVLKTARRIGLHRLPATEKALLRVGVFPVRDHYYEPLFNPGRLKRDLRIDRPLPAIDLRLADALSLLRQFRYAAEMRALIAGSSGTVGGDPAYAPGNGHFESGDADMWYAMIRHFRPRRIIEIGSGYSTLIARAAIRANQADDSAYACDHVCIEPFENRWLEACGVTVRRAMVEDLPVEFFGQLGDGDILFIDSSHMIRPQGDVVFEYLELLPTLRPGVIVHIHDIFTPRDYLPSWVVTEKRFWNEQYLLEAFLSFNSAFEVLLPVNHVHHQAYDRLAATCADLGAAREPGSFYIRRRT